MRKKVEAAMKALDYAPSAAAMNFASGRTGVVALVLNNLEGEWIPPVLLGIEKTINTDPRASLLLGSLSHDGKHDPTMVESWLTDRRVDAAIFMRPRRSEAKLIEIAHANDMPVALIAPDIPAKHAFELRSDNVQGGLLLGEHLLSLGHKRFAFVGGEKSSRDSKERLKGLQKALSEAGLQISDREIVAGTFSGEDGRAYARRWLKRKKATRPTAIVLADDSMALGLLGSLSEAGIKVPEDVSLTGFNNIPATQWIWPGLTTVEQPLRELGEAACQSVLNALNGKADAHQSTKIVFDVSLVPRNTTGKAPRR